MATSNKRYFIKSIWQSSIMLCLILIQLTHAGCVPNREHKDDRSPRFATTAWTDKCRQLLVRHEKDNRPALLLRCLTDEENLQDRYPEAMAPREVKDTEPKLPVLRYTPNETALEPVGAAEWISATSVIGGEARTPYRDIKPFQWNQKTDELRYGDKVAQMAGRWVVMIDAAPLGDWVAVLSANGTRKHFWGLPGLGGATTYSGDFFHQLHRFSTGAPVGPAILLDDAAGQQQLSLSWTSDGEYTLYQDIHRQFLWIVPNKMVHSNTQAR